MKEIFKHVCQKKSARMFIEAVFEIAPSVGREWINTLKCIHLDVTKQNQRVPEGLCDHSSTIFPSTATGMNELICFTMFRIKGLKVPED